jgi:hypothetical protein
MAHRSKRPDIKRRHPQTVVRRMAGEAVDATPLEIAINRAAKLLPCERQAVMEPVFEAFAAFRAGRGSASRLAQLADAMNVAADLAEKVKIASNHTHSIEAGKQAILAVLDRHAATGSWTLKGTEIADLDCALFIAKVQLDYCSRGELAGSVQRVISRCRSALADEAAGRVRPGVTVRDLSTQGQLAHA